MKFKLFLNKVEGKLVMNDSSELNKQLNRDNLLMSVWLHQMSAVWSMHRYAALVEAGGLSGWYLLFDKEKFILSSSLLVVCSVLLYLMIITIKRHTQLLKKYEKHLKKSGVLEKQGEEKGVGLLGGEWCKLAAHQLARLFIVFLIAVNLVLFFFTLYKSSCAFIIMALAVLHVFIIMVLIICWKKIILDKDKKRNPTTKK